MPPLVYLFNRQKVKKYAIISYYLLFSVFTDLFLTPTIDVLFKTPFGGARIFSIVEFSLLSFFIFRNTISNIKAKLFLFGSITFLLATLYENFIATYNNFDSITTGISALIILIYSIFYLFQIISSPNGIPKLDAGFTIIIAFIIYFAGTFFIYILSKNNFIDKSFQQSYTLINSSILLLRNIIITTAFLQSAKQENFNHSQLSRIKISH